jgi:hypothetical protein
MPDNFVSAVLQLFDNAKSAPARDRANFAIPKKDGTPFVPRQHYIQILVNDMYLAKEREWWVRYAPVALVAPTYMYDKEYKTAPVIIGPALFQQFSKDIGDGTIIRNAPVSSMHPYWGGAVTLTVIFSKVEKEDNADKVLDVLENFADIASPLTPAIPFSSYLKIAGNVMNGMRVLLNLPKTQPILAYRETINPQINQALAPQHLVLIDTPGLSDADKTKFYVKNGQLYYGDTDASAVPYRKNDFILLEIAQGSQRSDEGSLAFYPLWEQTRRLGLQSALQDGYWAEAKNQFNALKVAVSESPDLTEPDVKRLLEDYLLEMKEIRQGGAEEQSLDIKLPGEGAGALQEYQRIAKQLDELDQL